MLKGAGASERDSVEMGDPLLDYHILTEDLHMVNVN